MAVLLGIAIGTPPIAAVYGGTAIPILIAFTIDINRSHRHTTCPVRHCRDCRLVVRKVQASACPSCGKPMARARQRRIRP